MQRKLDVFRGLSTQTLARRVFTKQSSRADEIYFRQQLFDLVCGRREYCDTFTEFLWKIIYERSEGGSKANYLYFNERAQRLYVDWEFQAWAEKALAEIETVAAKMQTI